MNQDYPTTTQKLLLSKIPSHDGFLMILEFVKPDLTI